MASDVWDDGRGYFQVWDGFADDPVWDVLARRGATVDQLQAAYMRMLARTAHHGTNGYMIEWTALDLCRKRRLVLELLTAAVLGRPPLLHCEGDTCPCLGDSWVTGYAFRLHTDADA